MAIQETGCDRVRVQALDGAAYGAIISPANVGRDEYSDVTQWLFVGGVHSGEIMDTAAVLEEYADYDDGCVTCFPPGEIGFSRVGDVITLAMAEVALWQVYLVGAADACNDPGRQDLGQFESDTIELNLSELAAGSYKLCVYRICGEEISAPASTAPFDIELFCPDPYTGSLVLPAATAGVPYNHNIYLAGDPEFLVLSDLTVPAWMVVTFNAETGLVNLSGTPELSDVGEDIQVFLQVSNCGTGSESLYDKDFTIDVQQQFVVTALSNIPGGQNFSRSVFVPWLGASGRYISWVDSDDASGFRVATSDDNGETWTLRATTFTGSVNAMAVGADVIIGIGSGNQGVKSADGITWTTFAMPQAIQHRGIAYSPSLNLFVIVAQQGPNRVFTTVDGTSVTTITAPVLNTWYSIAWSPTLSLFVAVSLSGSGNQIMTSPDGAAWTMRTSPGANRSWSRVKWLNDKFVALASTGTIGQRIMYSTDGINWTLLTLSQNNMIFTDAAYGNGLYIAINSQSGSDYFWRSLDGITWINSGTSPAAQWTGINFNGDTRFVLTGIAGGGSGNRVAKIDWY